MYCLQSRPYIFQPGNFTGLGSEGVKPHRVRRGKRRDRGEISALIKLPKAVGGCRNYTLFCRLFLTSFVIGFVCLFVVLFCFQTATTRKIKNHSHKNRTLKDKPVTATHRHTLTRTHTHTHTHGTHARTHARTQ